MQFIQKELGQIFLNQTFLNVLIKTFPKRYDTCRGLFFDLGSLQGHGGFPLIGKSSPKKGGKGGLLMAHFGESQTDMCRVQLQNES